MSKEIEKCATDLVEVIRKSKLDDNEVFPAIGIMMGTLAKQVAEQSKAAGQFAGINWIDTISVQAKFQMLNLFEHDLQQRLAKAAKAKGVS